MAEWIKLSERKPAPGQCVLVKGDEWRVPRVLEFDIKAGFPRLIDRMSGRFFWYPERMHWTAIPGWPSPTLPASPTDQQENGNGTV